MSGDLGKPITVILENHELRAARLLHPHKPARFLTMGARFFTEFRGLPDGRYRVQAIPGDKYRLELFRDRMGAICRRRRSKESVRLCAEILERMGLQRRRTWALDVAPVENGKENGK